MTLRLRTFWNDKGLSFDHVVPEVPKPKDTTSTAEVARNLLFGTIATAGDSDRTKPDLSSFTAGSLQFFKGAQSVSTPSAIGEPASGKKE